MLIKRIVVSIFIAGIIAFSYGLFKERSNFSVITHKYPKNVFTVFKEGDIFAGEKLQVTIRSYENNLGIIAIRFNTFGKVHYDTFVFRIKEEGASNWYHINTYNAKEFGGFPFFPFGFPIISQSKDKSYTIELESKAGKKGDAIAIAQEEPTVLAKHKFSKAELLATKTLLLPLGVSVLSNIVQTKHVWYIFLGTFSFLFLPFLFKKYVKIKKVEISIKNSIKKIEYRVYKDKLGKRLGYVYELIEPLLVLVQFIVGKSFRFIARTISYLVKGALLFYKWLGKE